MRLYYLAGDRTTALREYERCVRALQREFDLPPMQATVDLYEQIRTERLVGAQASAVAQDDAAPASKPPIDLHQQVVQLQSDLAGFQVQTQQEFKTILHLLNRQLEISRQTQQETP
jgi:DNA-binding SARP family transcriptional activator